MQSERSVTAFQVPRHIPFTLVGWLENVIMGLGRGETKIQGREVSIKKEPH